MKKVLALVAIATLLFATQSCKTAGDNLFTTGLSAAKNKGSFKVEVDTVRRLTTVTASLDSCWKGQTVKRYLKRADIKADLLNGSFKARIVYPTDSLEALKAAGFKKLAAILTPGK
jgi:hypothetical protein